MTKFLYKVISLILIFFFTNDVLAQLNKYPGGVDNVQVWLKADDMVLRPLANSNEMDMWLNDINATDRNVTFTYDDVSQSGKLRPTLLRASYKMNFNNAVYFGGTHFLASKTGITGFSNAITVFGIYIAEKGKNETRMYYMGFGSTDPTSSSTRRPSIGFSPRETGGRVRLTGARDGHGGYEINTTALQTTYVPEGKDYVTFRFSGTEYSLDKSGKQLAGATVGALKPNEGIIIGGASISTGFFSGQLGEVIVYNRKLSASDTNKIESYLATKYGITLDNAAYTSSKGTIFWPWGRTGQGYHNNIAGILRDDDNTSIPVSRSTASGAALTVNTVGTKFQPGVGVTNKVPLPVNNSAIYWGTNIGSNYQSSKVSDGGCGYTEMLEGKYWKFKKTNLGSTNVEVRAGGEAFPYQGPGFEVKMLVAKTEADARNHNWMAVIPGKYVGGELEEHFFNLPIGRDELYITFGANVLSTSCAACTTSETGYFKFSTNNWASGVTNVPNLTASNGLKFDVTYKTYSNGKENASMQMRSYPRVSNGNILETRFRGVRGSEDNYAVTSIAFKDGATFAKFNIYGIDKNSTSTDMVEVVGYCGNITYKGSVAGTFKKGTKTFTVGDGVITGIKPSSITSKNGIATIEFPHEVTRIEIKHRIHYRTKSRGYQSIGIGDFELNCPRPPQPNPDGIEFTLQAPKTVLSCTDFNYTFKIWNYACNERYAKLDDELPEGMTWVDGGVFASDEALSSAVFNNYAGTKTLSIDKVKLLPNTYTTITARVRFKDDALPKVYENRGKLTYTSVNEDNKVVTIESCDYNNFTECVPTQVEMIYEPRVLSPEVTIEPVLAKCYRDKGIITIKAKVKNPNPTIDFTNLSLIFTYNEDFIFKKLTSNLVGGTVEKENGIHMNNDVTMNGGSTIELTYEVQALEFLALIEAATGNVYTNPRDVPDEDIAKVVEFGAELEVIGNSDNECVNASLDDVFAVLDPTIPFCGRDLSCYYPGVSGNMVKKNSDFVLVSTLDRTKVGGLAAESINAILYLESKSKGFVITRLTNTQINGLSNPVAGMVVYDTTNKCMKLYNGKIWSCIVQSCPDN
jgi:hypothetical protein